MGFMICILRFYKTSFDKYAYRAHLTVDLLNNIGIGKRKITCDIPQHGIILSKNIVFDHK